MYVRLLHIVGVSAILIACALLDLCIRQWCEGDSWQEDLPRSPSAVRMLIESAGERKEDEVNKVSPLVAQAEILAAYLNPPKPAKEKVTQALPVAEGKREAAPVVEGKREVAEVAPAVRPAAASVKFKLRGTSYYPNQPERSMALISDVGYAEGEERWVKEGSQLGHFTIHEIRKGMIVYRDGDQLREMTVEHGAEVPRLVRDMQSGSRKASGDIGVSSPARPLPPGPNNVEAAGGN